jgi:hypothetical protein
MTDKSKASPHLATPAAVCISQYYTHSSSNSTLTSALALQNPDTLAIHVARLGTAQYTSGPPNCLHAGYGTDTPRNHSSIPSTCSVRTDRSTFHNPNTTKLSVQITCQLLSQSIPCARHLHSNPPMATTLKPHATSPHLYIQISRLSLSSICSYACILQVTYSLQDFVQKLSMRFFLSTPAHFRLSQYYNNTWPSALQYADFSIFMYTLNAYLVLTFRPHQLIQVQ